jgi:hypothetical protein
LDDIKLFGSKNGTTLHVENFKYQDVVDYVSDGYQVYPFKASNGGIGLEITAPTRDGLLRYQAYPTSTSTGGPTIKVDYWNSSIEKWQFWTTFRFTE